MSGYIYCFSNDQIEDVYKIGRTTRDPITRLNEANSSGTWNITQVTYKFEFAKRVNDCCGMEKNIHDILGSFDTRVYPNREFFKLSLTTIKKIFDITDGEWYILGKSDEDKIIIPVKSDEDNNNIIEQPLDISTLIDKNDIINIDESDITCQTCSKIYTNRRSYNNHILLKRCKIKNDSVNCSYCSKSFSNKYNRTVHETKCSPIYNSKLHIMEEEINKLKRAVKKRGY
jgi:hypothetical protein